MTGDGLISVNAVGERPSDKPNKHEINYILDWADWRKAQEDKTKRFEKLKRKRGSRYDR